MICFLHIPKCGGSTVLSYIRRQSNSPEGRSDKRKTISCYGKTIWTDVNVTGEKLLLGLREEHPPESVKVIVGHYSYAFLEQYLGHTNTYPFSFSLARKPLERVFSNINYIRLKPGHRHFEYFSRLTVDNLYDFLVSRANVEQGDNSTYQLRFLTGLSHSRILENINSAIDLAMKRVQVYKLENSEAAITANVGRISPDKGVERVNITSDLLKGQSSAEVQSFHRFGLGDFTSKQLACLEDLYLPDFLFWERSA